MKGDGFGTGSPKGWKTPHMSLGWVLALLTAASGLPVPAESITLHPTSIPKFYYHFIL